MRTPPSVPAPLGAALLAVSALLLASCSVPRLLYQNADWLVLRELDGYMDLHEAQRDWVAVALEERLERHRREELPVFARSFQDAAARARRGFQPADARWVMERGRELLADTVDGTLPLVARALSELDADQRRHLAERIAERNQDFRERHHLDRSREERFARRARRLVDRLEDWTGPLNEEQVALVHAIRNGMPDSAPAWLAYSEERQRALLALLERGGSAAEIEALLRGWWLRLEGLPPELAAKRDRQVAALEELIVRLDGTLDSVQRAHLVGKLEDLARDARSLATET